MCAKSIIIYGGSFDPIHLGHVLIAEKAKEIKGVEKVIFIPTNITPLAKTLHANNKRRFEMIEIALSSFKDVFVDPIEINRQGLSYSWKTVKEYKIRYPNHKLLWLLGYDQFLNLPFWKNVDYLVANLHFIVVSRKNVIKEIPQIKGLKYNILNQPLLDYSSTRIRKNLIDSKSIRKLVPIEVERYIKENNLYESNIILNNEK